MKVIILSAKTGGGHISAAKAINEYLKNNGAEVKMLDTIETISRILNKTVIEIYGHIAKSHKHLWKLMYDTSNNQAAVSKLVATVNGTISKKLLPSINDFNPDIIIVTHPFAAEMISSLKSAGKITVPLVCVMTDYAPHRTWINDKTDAYIVANDQMIKPMEEIGVDPKIIYPFGIPINEDFHSPKNKEEVLKSIGFSQGVPTILMMAGCGGIANIAEIYEKLQSLKTDVQIIIITGKNQKLYNNIRMLASGEEIKKRKFILKHLNLKKLRLIKKPKKLSFDNKDNRKKTKVIYFTNEVSKYMQSSDLIITKPGGLTVSEALACNLPMALFNAIPGQEEENANFLVKNNMAVRLTGGKYDIKIIENLLTDPKRLNAMKLNCQKFDKSDCLKNIYKVIQKLLK